MTMYGTALASRTPHLLHLLTLYPGLFSPATLIGSTTTGVLVTAAATAAAADLPAETASTAALAQQQQAK